MFLQINSTSLGLLSAIVTYYSSRKLCTDKHSVMTDKDGRETEPRQDVEVRDRAKTRQTSVKTETRPRREKPYLKTVSRQNMCLETPSLVGTETRDWWNWARHPTCPPDTTNALVHCLAERQN